MATRDQCDQHLLDYGILSNQYFFNFIQQVVGNGACLLQTILQALVAIHGFAGFNAVVIG